MFGCFVFSNPKQISFQSKAKGKKGESLCQCLCSPNANWHWHWHWGSRTFRKHDINANENVTQKYVFTLSDMLCDYFNPLNFKMCFNYPGRYVVAKLFKSRKRKKNFTVVCPRFLKTLNLVISRRCFWSGRQRNVLIFNTRAERLPSRKTSCFPTFSSPTPSCAFKVPI